MSAKRQLLTQTQYDALAFSFEWTKVELGLAAIQGTPGVQRKADLLGAYGSGDANAAEPLNGQNAKIIEIDLLDHVIVGDNKADPLGIGHYSFREAANLRGLPEETIVKGDCTASPPRHNRCKSPHADT